MGHQKYIFVSYLENICLSLEFTHTRYFPILYILRFFSMSKDEIVANLNQKLFKSGMLFVIVSCLVAVTDALTNTAEGRVS